VFGTYLVWLGLRGFAPDGRLGSLARYHGAVRRIAFFGLCACACGDPSDPGTAPIGETDNSGCGYCSGPEAGEEGTGDTGDPECGDFPLVVDRVEPRLMLALDISGSMFRAWDHDNNPETPPITRWQSVHGVVEDLIDAYGQDLELGLQLFPQYMAAEACDVADQPEVPPGPGNGGALLLAMPPADLEIHEGGTPMYAGLAGAVGGLEALDDPRDAIGPGAMLLVTDGAPGCEGTDEGLVEIVEGANAIGIRTYVVGIEVAYGILGTLAGAGGTHDAYTVLDPGALSMVVGEIADQVSVCVLGLDPVPDNPDFLAIHLDGDEVTPVNDCETDDGWVFVDGPEPFSTVELCGAACDLLRADVNAEVSAVILCPPVSPGP
jgi:hypothetical protein